MQPILSAQRIFVIFFLPLPGHMKTAGPKRSSHSEPFVIWIIGDAQANFAEILAAEITDGKAHGHTSFGVAVSKFGDFVWGTRSAFEPFGCASGAIFRSSQV